MKFKTLIFVFLYCTTHLFAGTEKDTVIVRRTMAAQRVAIKPKIDGALDDEAWKTAEIATHFSQNSPKEKAPVSFDTEVRITYDNTAIYIGAMCYDNSPDSIKKQLSLRDEYPNADNFRVVFDTYNTQQDAFDFTVTASNVQNDSRFSDYNFNAVWISAVKILENGWSVEMEIPWSALRFPSTAQQNWGLQITRSIQRKFEFDQWALSPKGSPNPMKYWGILTGLDNIEAPVRLSLTPYVATILQKDSRFGPSTPSASIGGGLGLKYGINESFTLDMTLLPDFSQVKSDNIVKNLSPFEIQFEEQRPFFTEGVDLFNLGGIFYSRRIGRTPSEFYDAPYLADSTEEITKNPTQSRLMNATKITGRTNDGLGIGILNAYVANTFAIATDTVTGKTRKILTEPASNYNIFVFDKQLANSSRVYVTNTNVIRSHGYRSANVTATGFSVNNKKSTWNVNGDGGVSNVLEPTYTTGNYEANVGYYYQLGITKNSGKLQYGANRQVVNRNWDCNDMGINLETNYANNGAWIGYYVFNPWKFLNNAEVNLSVNYTTNLETHDRNSLGLNLFTSATFKNFWSGYFGAEWMPYDQRDFYEPREDGRFYLRTRYKTAYGGFNTNTNKPVWIGIDYHGGATAKVSQTIPVNPWGGAAANVNWRIGNRFSFRAASGFHGDFGDRGWVGTEDDGTIVFGRRTLRSWENGVTANFVFTTLMSVSLQARHYWQTGNYHGYYILNQDGTLTDYVNWSGAGTKDFSFNSVNVDLVYNWNFAPGSWLSIAWKQNILSEEPIIDYSYSHNLNHTIHGPQLNQISVRLLYYLDYIYVKQRVDDRKKP
ncbi:MAG: DUF5916 domain-containing protein [Bacteroidia bacterium]